MGTQLTPLDNETLQSPCSATWTTLLLTHSLPPRLIRGGRLYKRVPLSWSEVECCSAVQGPRQSSPRGGREGGRASQTPLEGSFYNKRATHEKTLCRRREKGLRTNSTEISREEEVQQLQRRMHRNHYEAETRKVSRFITSSDRDHRRQSHFIVATFTV